MILSKEDIKRHVSDFFKDKPVDKVWLFGSYARGESDDESDIDILISFQKDSKVGWEYYGWSDDISEAMNKKVDVVSEGVIKSVGLAPNFVVNRAMQLK